MDPVIRRATGVEPEGAVLIFDEAHNIEDMSRWGGGVRWGVEVRWGGGCLAAEALLGYPHLESPWRAGHCCGARRSAAGRAAERVRSRLAPRRAPASRPPWHPSTCRRMSAAAEPPPLPHPAPGPPPREAGSAEIDLEVLKLAWLGLERAATHGSAPDTYRPLADATMGLIQRLRALAADAGPGAWRAAGFETQERVWSGQEVRGVGWGGGALRSRVRAWGRGAAATGARGTPCAAHCGPVHASHGPTP
jgi:hypothetical protein